MLQRFSFSLFSQRNIKSFLFLVGILSIFEASATIKSSDASSRIKQWHTLIQTAKFLPEKEKLVQVNNFFNQHIKFVNDINLWGVNDYWATPQEILNKGAGDCEDYSIAKYFTLIKLGVPKNKIRLTYVKFLTYNKNQSHMVLTYSPSPQAEPEILDNVIPGIQPASKRKDLLPVFSFNDSGLWLTEFRGSDKKVGDSFKFAMWADLKRRM